MKILVTGGAGFIGSHIVDALVERGHDVQVIDNLSSGKKENVNPGAHLHTIDITDFAKMETALNAIKPDVIFHLAAQIDLRKSLEDPIFDAKTNIFGSINLINLAITHKVQKIIFSSTGGAIYGETNIRPTPEDHPEWPLSPYGIAKLTIDKYLHYAREIHSLKSISLRYANVYGPRQNAHGEAGVVAIFLDKMLHNEQPIINGNGLQTRDYVFVADVANANLLAMENLETCGVFNVGTGIETSVVELFDRLNALFENQFPKKHGSAKAGEQMTSSLAADKIGKTLDWQGTTELNQGLMRTFEWFQSQHKKTM